MAPATASSQLAGLQQWAKRVLLAELVAPGDEVCEMFCGRGEDTPLWVNARIASYLGVGECHVGVGECHVGVGECHVGTGECHVGVE
ncbi:unnamed protein product [Closterium sp. Yama58-4]|nr:unnamed protein product [Closterium sp. Yama58-4]